MPRYSTLLTLFAAAVAWLGLAAPALAHPHVFVTSRTEILYDASGAVKALRHRWSFDEAYSAYMVQGLDKNGDGKLTSDELAELAKVNMESLPDVGFFTIAKANGKAQEFGTPGEASLSYENKILTLTYTLPLKTPATANRSFGIEIGDPPISSPSRSARRLMRSRRAMRPRAASSGSCARPSSIRRRSSAWRRRTSPRRRT